MSMLTPTFAVVGSVSDDGEGHFKKGIKYENAQEWDKAVEEFALAVSATPKNPEYRLHLTRALFNASQMFMRKGKTAADEKDYESAYVAFRRAYAYDPSNELAKSELERMVRLQREVNNGGSEVKGDKSDQDVKLVPTGYVSSANPGSPTVPQRIEKLRDIPFPNGVDLQFIIKELARDLDLNVLFDNESFRTPGRKTYIELKNVSAAFALDAIFLQEGLFFQKVGPRTIIVANQAQRTKFQQLFLRTFYLQNASPKDVAKVVQTAIPAQPGRSQTIVLTDDATNSITIRDTGENIRLIGQLINSLDKDRAEVVMDVAIYEVNKSDLLQLGNQIGTKDQLTNFQGSQPGVVRFGGNPLLDAAGAALSSVIPAGIILPSANLSAFQSKNDTKLLAFSQIHAFNNEDSSARIGQRVPVQSAQFLGTSTVPGQNNGFGQSANVINYEQVGLTLKFKPIVFPNQDVQVAMEIESKDVSGAQTLTPTFTERTIKGTARIQNNKTLLLASVAQDVESKGRSGLPFLGLIPLIGRLFTAPTRDNRKVDIVIAVTPRVIRAPAILPDDEVERPTGSLAVPTNSSLEAMIVEEDRQELLAAARRLPKDSVVQLPDQAEQAPEYVKTSATVEPQQNPTIGTQPTATGTQREAVVAAPPLVAAATTNPIEVAIPNLKAIDTGVKALQLTQTADTPATEQPLAEAQPDKPAETIAAPTMELSLSSELAKMKAGEKVKIPVTIQGSGKFRSAVMGLQFDDKKIAVRSVSFGDVFGTTAANTVATPFINQNGKMYVSLIGKDDSGMAADGTLAYIEIEALTDCKPKIEFDRDVLNFLTADGKNFAVTFKQ